MEYKKTLIIGGTSGLGLELARNMSANDERAIITGRHDPQVGFAEYKEFDLSGDHLPSRIGQFVLDLPPISSLIYAAGFFQEGHITDLSDEQVDDMINIGGRGLIFFTKKLLEKQDQLDELVTITSTSQWVPREFEPVYNFAKAGAAHYSHGLSLDPRIRKTLVVGPSGMDTEFWSGSDNDTTKMMRPEKVARQIMNLRERNKHYTFAKILGVTETLPQRVEVEFTSMPDWVPERKGLPMGMLRALQNEVNPNNSNRKLSDLLGCDESQISRCGKRLLDNGYVQKQKTGRENVWSITEVGSALCNNNTY
ncbi:MAG: SDR family NAD(P)-dependent oxidoreductase [bacterium]|nr:SDR family NAD(P)-dependent oxidoreductase [bacterium]